MGAAVQNPEPGSLRRFSKGELFLRGPIPWVWLERAMRLPGRALHVALFLWLKAGIIKSALVTVNLSRLSVDRSAASRGLAALEAAGLIRVERKPGRKPLVTILPMLGIRQ